MMKMIYPMIMNRDRDIISKMEKINFNKKIMKIKDYLSLTIN